MLGPRLLPVDGAGRVVEFFFSSRRRHTRYWRDWSSDVCSSDLPIVFFDRTYFPVGTAIDAKIGITQGFYEYEWRKDGVTIARSTGSSRTILSPGHEIGRASCRERV